MSTVEKQQDGFKSKWGFIMACIGSAVGMANIWRFPVMVSKYGGPYFLFCVYCTDKCVQCNISLVKIH